MDNFDKAQRAYDNMMPEEPEECPECGGEMIIDGRYASCSAEDCDFSFDGDDYEEPDDFDTEEPECWKHGMDA